MNSQLNQLAAPRWLLCLSKFDYWPASTGVKLQGKPLACIYAVLADGRAHGRPLARLLRRGC